MGNKHGNPCQLLWKLGDKCPYFLVSISHLQKGPVKTTLLTAQGWELVTVERSTINQMYANMTQSSCEVVVPVAIMLGSTYLQAQRTSLGFSEAESPRKGEYFSTLWSNLLTDLKRRKMQKRQIMSWWLWEESRHYFQIWDCFSFFATNWLVLIVATQSHQ